MKLILIAVLLLTGCVSNQPYTTVDCEGQHERYNQKTGRCELP
jgi:hypothetical protein